MRLVPSWALDGKFLIDPAIPLYLVHIRISCSVETLHNICSLFKIFFELRIKWVCIRSDLDMSINGHRTKVSCLISRVTELRCRSSVTRQSLPTFIRCDLTILLTQDLLRPHINLLFNI